MYTKHKMWREVTITFSAKKKKNLSYIKPKVTWANNLSVLISSAAGCIA